jgi:S-adenosyl methyltransferase
MIARMGANELSAADDYQIRYTAKGPERSPAPAGSVRAADLPRIDTSRPNMARVYDYWLGGKDNFAADRELAQRTLALCPELPRWAHDNRAFVCAAARRAAQAGITQFIDLGCGLPTRPAVHEAAMSVNSGARVAYVDNDPVVIVHARALLGDAGLTAVLADLTDPEAVLADPGLRKMIDLSQPACVILGGVLHFQPAARARALCAAWADRLASGSWLAVSVGSYTDPELLAQLTAIYTPAPFQNHAAGDVASFLTGLDLIPPGVAEAGNWQAGIEAAPPDRGLYVLCAAGIKH